MKVGSIGLLKPLSPLSPLGESARRNSAVTPPRFSALTAGRLASLPEDALLLTNTGQPVQVVWPRFKAGTRFIKGVFLNHAGGSDGQARETYTSLTDMVAPADMTYRGLRRIFKTAWVPINAHEAVFHEPKAEGNRLMITVQETGSDQTHQYFSRPIDAFDDLDPTEVVFAELSDPKRSTGCEAKVARPAPTIPVDPVARPNAKTLL